MPAAARMPTKFVEIRQAREQTTFSLKAVLG